LPLANTYAPQVMIYDHYHENSVHPFGIHTLYKYLSMSKDAPAVGDIHINKNTTPPTLAQKCEGLMPLTQMLLMYVEVLLIQ